MTAAYDERLQHLMHAGDQAAWSTAALVLALTGRCSAEQRSAAEEVLRAAGADAVPPLDAGERDRVAAQAAAPLLQAAALLRGDAQSWAGQSDEALLAQGRASAMGAAAFARFGVPMMAGTGELLARPGVRMLDVGTGVAALAVAYAEQFPQLTVVGLDVLPRVLDLAARTVAESDVAERVVLRRLDVSELDETDVYALAWLPAPFLPEAALRAGTPRVCEALVPGGWLMLGHGRFTGDPLEDALNRFKTLAYGGTALDDPQAEQLLRAAGLVEIRTLPTPPGSPSITIGRKPPA